MTKRFTLVEVLMVTGMIALIAALIIVSYNGVYRSWSSRNTIATMKAAQLALDKYRLENGGFFMTARQNGMDMVFCKTNDDEKMLANDLLHGCTPFSKENSDGEVTVFDDFGMNKPLFYIYFRRSNTITNPLTEATETFALVSSGKDGKFADEYVDNDEPESDDILFLPAGYNTLAPGFYMVTFNRNTPLSFYNNDVEPLAK